MTSTDYDTDFDANAGPPTVAAHWTQASVAIIFVTLRLYTQSCIVRKVRIEDYLIMGSLAMMLINSSLITAAVKWGIGRHIEYLTPEQLMIAMKLEFISGPFGIASATLSRVSFAVFLLKFCIASRIWQWSIKVLIWTQILGNIVIIVLIFLQCQHVTHQWDPNAGGTCWSPKVQTISGYTIGGVNATHDLILVLLPINIIRSLRLQMRVKVALGLVMCTSIFACMASIKKTIELKTFGDRQDVTYQTARFDLWMSVENYVLICAASVPALRPLLLSLTRRSSQAPKAPYIFRWSPTRSRTRIPMGYFRQDTVINPSSHTSTDPLATLSRGPTDDLEKGSQRDVEKSQATLGQSETACESMGSEVDPHPPWPLNNTMRETKEITLKSESAT